MVKNINLLNIYESNISTTKREKGKGSKKEENNTCVDYKYKIYSTPKVRIIRGYVLYVISVQMPLV